MVWVSNRGNKNIYVSITNKSGGSADSYLVKSQSQEAETPGQNLWKRTSEETLMTLLREGGKEQLLMVGPSDIVRVYSEAVIVSQANVLIA